jgi:hypothetical protein
MRVYVDPHTGKVIERPTGVGEPPKSQPRRALPQVRPGTSPAGGYEVQLDDRFTNSMEVTPGKDGTPQVGCHDQKAE